ncbi:hypothetical protein [Serratia fonticola]|uniref:hypothetical protein n=1 Tax=Serratia fonticola TaxID=47917 RepID=UPI003AB047C6
MTKSPTRFEPDVGFVTDAPEMYVNTAGSYIKFEDYEQLKRQLDAVVAECAKQKAIIGAVTDLNNEPQYHPEGMGCGLEDRGITDRYDAMQYGWEQAMERIYGEVIPCAEELSFPATDAVLAEVETKLVEKFAEQQEEKSSAAERAGAKHLGAAHQFAALQARAFAVDLREGRV